MLLIASRSSAPRAVAHLCQLCDQLLGGRPLLGLAPHVLWSPTGGVISFIREVNETQLWLNLLFLFCLSLVPFAAEVLGDHPDFRAGAVLYGLDLTACTGALYLIWEYAWNRGHVLVKDSDTAVVKRFRRRTLHGALAYLLATGVAWFSPRTGFYLYIAIVVVFAFSQIRRKAIERVLRHT